MRLMQTQRLSTQRGATTTQMRRRSITSKLDGPGVVFGDAVGVLCAALIGIKTAWVRVKEGGEKRREVGMA